MKRNLKFLIILAIVLVLGIIVYFSFFKKEIPLVTTDNTATAVIARDYLSPNVTINLSDLEPATFSISGDPVTSGELEYRIDPAQSFLYKLSGTDQYLLNLFTTIKPSTANACYNLSELVAKTAAGTEIKFNRLGNPDYIFPFSNQEENTYGDLPVSFCLDTAPEMSGGLSFIIPQTAFTPNITDLLISFPNESGLPVALQLQITQQ